MKNFSSLQGIGHRDMDEQQLIFSSNGSEPTIALLHYFELIDDFLNTINISFETFCKEFVGSWMFGYVNALRKVGVRTVLFCITASVDRPSRFVHLPTDTPICALPPARIYRPYRAMRRKTVNLSETSSAQSYKDSESGEGNRRSRLVPIKNLARSLGGYLSTPLGLLARELRRENCQAILCQEYEFARFDMCVLLGQLMHLPVFATFQGGNKTQSWLEFPLRRLALHKCRGVIIPTHSEIERVCDHYGIPTTKIARIFNPLDVAAWNAIERREARAALGIPLDARVVAWHGRIEIETKGLDILLKAWQQICQERPDRDLRLIVLGTGSDAEQFRQRLDAMQLRGVFWLNEFVRDRAIVCRYLCAADVYTLPSRNEGFPVAPIEAMSCGLPVVAADAPGVPDILEGGEASGGILVPHGDATALALALGRILDDQAWGDQLGKRGRLRVESCFSSEVIGKQLRDFLLSQSLHKQTESYGVLKA